jgi:formate dehydrogenase major subunit
MKNMYINGTKVSFDNDQTVLEACRTAGIDVPTLCYDERLKGSGSCRICMVEVDDGSGRLVPACVTSASDGMKVQTDSEKVTRYRKQLLELMLSDHNANCLQCEKTGDCALQDYAYEYEVDIEKYQGRKKEPGVVESNEFFYLDQSKCILCTKCTRVCNELQGNKVWSISERGFETEINTPFNIDMEEGNCVSCGNCVSACPVGALLPKKPKKEDKYRSWEVKRTQTTCPYCGVGCQLYLLTKGNKIVGVEPVKDSVNNGLLCVKGKFGYHFVNHPDRLTDPLIKRKGKFEKATWEEAYAFIKKKMTKIKEDHGPDAFGFFASAKISSEDNYMVQKFARAVIGTNSVDCCARL